MTKINLIFDLNKSKQIYKDYYDFEFKREVNKIPIKFLLIFFAVLIILGILRKVDILFYIGLISIVVIFVFLFQLYVRFKISYSKLMTRLKASDIDSEREFVYSFNDNEIKYKSKNVESSISWNLIYGYIENKENLYLYMSEKELYDIISKKILGESNYSKFKAILEKKEINVLG